jgi:hypothetical protein
LTQPRRRHRPRGCDDRNQPSVYRGLAGTPAEAQRAKGNRLPHRQLFPDFALDGFVGQPFPGFAFIIFRRRSLMPSLIQKHVIDDK